MKIQEKVKLINNKGYTIAIALSLIFVSSLLIGYYVYVNYALSPEGYTTIYIINYPQKEATDYPEVLVINENNTFNVWVVVENHMSTEQSFEVRQKVVSDIISSFPVEANVEKSYSPTIESGDIWETLATVSIDEPGSYSVIFELWIYEEEGMLEFSHNYCVLNIEVIDQI